MQTHRRPDLRAPVVKLLEKLIPAVNEGGNVPLTALVEAVAGDKLLPEVRTKLDLRGAAVFSSKDGAIRFMNEGPAVKIPLKRFDLKIPPRISGQARLVEGGAELRFHASETLSASKLFFSLRLERIEATDRRLLVDMEGDAFDQCFELV
ncbi:hypothetical protein [Polyangium aurulentum]|uniref:hypothetical protein n=1 Tax=Polyangium aurulentum TaxID=2567896 RepID=UPI0010ADBB39|nr:hypothetical protein [Polyangium aurulentum]UQA58877.1 hypothetical protein E8A73_047945 [Polyangium aurulentum]